MNSTINVTPIASSSKGNAYLLDDGQSPLLLDCGLPSKELLRRANFRLSRLAGCLVSHEHKDHSRAAERLRYTQLYMSKGTAEALGLVDRCAGIVQAGRQFKVEYSPWRVMPFQAAHDAAEPLGFLVYHQPTKAKILYAIDTHYIKHSFTGLTHIMIEASYQKSLLLESVGNGTLPAAQAQRLLLNHQSIETALRFLSATDMSAVQEIYLMHLSAGNSDEQYFRNAARKLTGRPVYICEE